MNALRHTSAERFLCMSETTATWGDIVGVVFFVRGIAFSPRRR